MSQKKIKKLKKILSQGNRNKPVLNVANPVLIPALKMVL